ncbi:MAG TPA: hypothetical protein VLL73_07005, partial [Desulfurivibrionaceae bacterium]|nr:hypothetical protein [Desulfurivibrionaceae bacterium]
KFLFFSGAYFFLQCHLSINTIPEYSPKRMSQSPKKAEVAKSQKVSYKQKNSKKLCVLYFAEIPKYGNKKMAKNSLRPPRRLPQEGAKRSRQHPPRKTQNAPVLLPKQCLLRQSPATAPLSPPGGETSPRRATAPPSTAAPTPLVSRQKPSFPLQDAGGCDKRATHPRNSSFMNW